MLMTMAGGSFSYARLLCGWQVMLLVSYPVIGTGMQRYGVSPIQLGVFMLFGMNLGTLRRQ
jgi:hypothetical protein